MRLKQVQDEKVIALSGNPNVGKSTIFNHLTGMNQHTGNWAGKTVSNTQGYCNYQNQKYTLVDIPGTYSLMAHSVEEEIARNFICFGEVDAVVVVCDATCLERNLNLVLQTMELHNKVIVCVNLLDEARRKQIEVDLEQLSKELKVPVVGVTARKKKSLEQLLVKLDQLQMQEKSVLLNYPIEIENAINIIEPVIKEKIGEINARWVSIRLLCNDTPLIKELNTYLKKDLYEEKDIIEAVEKAEEVAKINNRNLEDIIVRTIMNKAEQISNKVVTYKKEKYNDTDRKIDAILTSKWFGYPIMIIFLAIILWITITGANYPSEWLASFLFKIQNQLTKVFVYFHAPEWLHGIVVLGMYRVLAWVVSVMLPPMMIFFPMFTLLEDVGFLPRIAYNLDYPFKKCSACGKQALTMCMGFGCNAAGVVGCRIIDSPRERLIAIITNNFVPCNGRFPTLIALILMFFVGTTQSFINTIWSASILTMVILFGVGLTFVVSKFLSKTLLKGLPSSFILELPPYRRPQVGKVIIRSIFDRTLFVLGRAIIVAAPTGMIIWLLANIMIKDISILNYCTNFIDPFARLLGLDGVILMAFILGFPANEIVIPIIIMSYLSQGNILELNGLNEMKELFIAHGWTFKTAVCTMLFSMVHWPCSTTLLTIKKETGSLKWTMLAILIPTILGFSICFITSNIISLF